MNKQGSKGIIRIGTSNTTLPGNKRTFPPAYQQRSRLHYYATIFNTVEINSCFYKTPQRTTYEKWALDVPPGFRFTLKLSKLITHSKEMLVDLACLEHFMQTAYGTGLKKGCLLVQFPGKLTLDGFEKVEHILHELAAFDPGKEWRIAVEFRNTSWYVGEALELLAAYGATMVLHDHPRAKNFELLARAGFIYLRFHGPNGNYRDSYSPAFIKDRAQAITEWVSQGKDVYAYFNNTAGDAFANALYLKELLAHH